MILIPIIYLVVGLVAILRFGELLNDSILVNIGYKYPIGSATWESKKQEWKYTAGDDASSYWESYIMEMLFLIILACHIPYLFYSGKEALLIIIDEAMRSSISLVLSKKAL